MLLRQRVKFSKEIYIIAKYCFYIISGLLSKVEHLLASPSFKPLIVLISLNYIGIVLSQGRHCSQYNLRAFTRYKPVARHTTQKTETLTIVKLAEKSLMRHNQAKIIKKSVFLFWLPDFLFWTCMSKIRNAFKFFT